MTETEIAFSGLVLVLLLLGRSRLRRWHQRRSEADLRRLRMADVDAMDGIEFEHFVAWVLRNIGYREVQVTRASGDFGADVLAIKGKVKYTIQVKRQDSNVSRRAVSDSVAAKPHYDCSGAMVVTNAYFTRNAVLFAESTGCVLVDRNALLDWLAQISPGVPEFKTKASTSLEVRDDLERDDLLDDSEVESERPPRDRDEEVRAMPGIEIDRNPRAASRWIPVSVYLCIWLRSLKEWPFSMSMRRSTRQDQRHAYRKVAAYEAAHLSVRQLEEIKERADEEWPGDFEMQLDEIREQVGAMRRLAQDRPKGLSVDVLNSIRKKAEQEWPGDALMQETELNDQVDAYCRLKGLKMAGVSLKRMKTLKAAAAAEWPGDYVMQIETILEDRDS